MFQTYLLTAFRNLRRNQRHALLNIAGLGLAIGACLLIFTVIRFELGFNRHLSNYDRIFQVITRDQDADGEHFTPGVPFPTLKHLQLDYPEARFGQFMMNYGTQINLENASPHLGPNPKFIEEKGVVFADPGFVEMMEFRFLSGNAQVLSSPDGIAISKSIAERYYGDWKQANGKRIRFDNQPQAMQVKAVFEDLPANTDFPFQLMASYKGFEVWNPSQWPLDDWGSNSSSHQVFALLPPGTNQTRMEKELLSFHKKHSANKSTQRQHFLEPISKLHFDDRFSTPAEHQTTYTSLYTLASIGFLILLMACINYVNLSTALAISRSKEVGVRKVLGGTRAQVRWQVFSETGLLVSLSTALGIGLASLASPYVKEVLMAEARLDLISWEVWVFLLVLMGATTFLAGFYPAFVMGRFNPVEAIKSKIPSQKIGNLSLRRALVVVQFAFAQVLIMATLVALGQMDFMQKADLGFKKEAVLLVQGISDKSRQLAFKQELLARSDVKSVSNSFDAPCSENSWQSNFAFDSLVDRDFGVNMKFADADYLKTYGIQLVAGRMYAPSDTLREYLVNETFLKRVGVKNPEDAIGKLLRVGGKEPKPVCGVVKDFHMQSMHNLVPPIALMPNDRWMGMTGVQLSGANPGKSRDEIEALWDKHFPELVYNASFLDESIEKFYQNEKRMSLLYQVYAFIAIFISGLGLYGLISFIVVQKTREIGVRKVLGASVESLVMLFSKEFAWLILFAFGLAAPAAWYFMGKWLEAFAYKISMSPWIFLGALFGSGLLAMATVGYKSMLAARANPVKSLRTE